MMSNTYTNVRREQFLARQRWSTQRTALLTIEAHRRHVESITLKDARSPFEVVGVLGYDPRSDKLTGVPS